MSQARLDLQKALQDLSDLTAENERLAREGRELKAEAERLRVSSQALDQELTALRLSYDREVSRIEESYRLLEEKLRKKAAKKEKPIPGTRAALLAENRRLKRKLGEQ